MTYCVVEADTYRYYQEQDRLADLEEKTDDVIADLIDDLLFYGKAEYRGSSWFLPEIIYDLCVEDEDGEILDSFVCYALNLFTGKGKERDKEEADTDMGDFLKKHLEDHMAQFKNDLLDEVEKQLEEDRYDY
jgi:hypothetical protein